MYSSTVTQFEEPPRKKSPEEIAAEPIPLPPQSAEQPLIWRNVIAIAVLHIVAVYSFATRYHEAQLWTWLWTGVKFYQGYSIVSSLILTLLASGATAVLYVKSYHLGPFYGLSAGLGITAGAHRLWAHRSYSAKIPLRIFLAMLYCMGGQTCLFKWIRDHRTHHRYTETPADPHDANRGFFFSHVGWLMMRRHPAVKAHGSKVDMSDILADPVIQFADKYYTPIMLFLCFVFPTLVPVYVWGETWTVSILAVTIRYVWLLNATFLVNSFAHMWGNRPYNSHVKPTENPTVSFFTLGEGWHNYHHSFPWDYKAAELGAYGLNPTTGFIELMAWFGLAYNLKTPSKEIVKKISLTKGDGTDSFWGNHYHDTHHSSDERRSIQSR